MSNPISTLEAPTLSGRSGTGTPLRKGRPPGPPPALAGVKPVPPPWQSGPRPVLVAGHLRPDTDSVVSAVVYAELLNALSGTRVHRGVVLGKVSRQTEWLFQTAGAPLPPVVADLRLSVSGVLRDDVATLSSAACLGDAIRLIREHGASTVPVLDNDRHIIGVLSDRLPMAHYFYNFNMEDFLGVLYSLSDLQRGLGLNRWQAGTRVANGALSLDPTTAQAGDVVLVGDRPEVLAQVLKRGAAAVIACAPRRTAAWQRAVRLAPGLGVYQFRGSLLALTSQLPLAIPVANVMATDFPKLGARQTVEEIRALVSEKPFALPVVDDEERFVGVVSRAELLGAPRQQVILVDHFEQHQAGAGAMQAEILEIVDHHRVGTLETPMPIRVDCRPVGSTATIIACKFSEADRRPTRAQAVLLLGAIVADTLLLRSPTTTEVDRTQARVLAKRGGVNLESFGREVLMRGDETLDRGADELVEMDLKEFTGGGLRFAVAQIETVDRTRLEPRRLEELAVALRHRRERGAWDFAALMVTDIFRGDSLVLADALSPALSRKLLSNGKSGEVWPGCVSRKKQFLPEVLHRLNGDSR